MNVESHAPLDENQGAMELFLVLLVSILFPPILLFGFFVVKPAGGNRRVAVW